MKRNVRKKMLSAIVSVSMIASSLCFATVASAANSSWIYIGPNSNGEYQEYLGNGYYLGDDLKAYTTEPENWIGHYSKDTGVLDLKGTKTIKGWNTQSKSTPYGAALYSDGDLTINLADGADITFESGAFSGWVCALYSKGNVTVKGNGKVTFKVDGTNSEGGAGAVYCPSGAFNVDGAEVVIDGADKDFGIYQASSVNVKGGGTLEIKGAKAARFDFGLSVGGVGSSIKASESYDGDNGAAYNAADVESYKYIKMTSTTIDITAPATAPRYIYMGEQLNGNYQFYVSGKTSGGTGSSVIDEDGTYTIVGGEDDRAFAFYEDGVLKFKKNAVIGAPAQNSGNTAAQNYGAALHTKGYSGDLVIYVPSGVDVTLQGADWAGYTYGFCLDGGENLTVIGNGTLRIKAGDIVSTNGYSSGIYGNGKLNIEVNGAKLYVEGGSAKDGAAGASHAISNVKSVNCINGGEFIASVDSLSDNSGDSAMLGQTKLTAKTITAKTDLSGDEIGYSEADKNTYKMIHMTGAGIDEPVDVKTGVYIGEYLEFGKESKFYYNAETKQLQSKGVLGQNGVIAYYDAETNTINFAGVGTIENQNYLSNYGAGIYSDRALNINVAKGAEITIDSRNIAPADDREIRWSYGIYVSSGDLNISGEGTLNVYPRETTVLEICDSSAVCTYNGGVTIDGAAVNAVGGTRGMAINFYPQKGGKLTVLNNAKLNLKTLDPGQRSAINNDSANDFIVYDGAKVYGALDENGVALEEYNAENLVSYKYLAVQPEKITLNELKDGSLYKEENGEIIPVTTVSGGELKVKSSEKVRVIFAEYDADKILRFVTAASNIGIGESFVLPGITANEEYTDKLFVFTDDLKPIRSTNKILIGK